MNPRPFHAIRWFFAQAFIFLLMVTGLVSPLILYWWFS